MPRSQEDPADVKTDRLALRVTEEEKTAALAVAAALGQDDHSLLLRSMSLTEIMARAEGVAQAFGEPDFATAFKTMGRALIVKRAEGIKALLKG